MRPSVPFDGIRRHPIVRCVDLALLELRSVFGQFLLFLRERPLRLVLGRLGLQQQRFIVPLDLNQSPLRAGDRAFQLFLGLTIGVADKLLPRRDSRRHLAIRRECGEPRLL